MSLLHEAAAAGDIKLVIECLKLGFKVNDMSYPVTLKGKYYPEKKGKFSKQRTPLHLAAYNGCTEVVKILIAAGADIEQTDNWGQTALDIALSNRNFGTAILLHAAGASEGPKSLTKALSKRDIPNELYLAAMDKKPSIVREIYRSGLLTQEAGQQCLIYAARYNAPSVAEALIEYGISPDAYNGVDTALGTAAQQGNDAIAGLLLREGATVDKYTFTAPWQTDCTPLCEALMHRGEKPANPRLIKLLLSYGADIGKINTRGLTSLAEQGKPEEMRILLQHGFNPNTLINGKRLLDICLDRQQFELAILLINYGADVTVLDDKGRSYLHKSNHVWLTKLLLAKGLDKELQDDQGKTPIECVSTEVAEFLADHGASVKKLTMNHHVVLSSPRLTRRLIKEGLAHFDIQDENGTTPLRKLVKGVSQKGYLDTLMLVLKSNVSIDINQADPIDGWTALHEAFSANKGFASFFEKGIDDNDDAVNQYRMLIDLLITYGAKPLRDKAGRTPIMCMNRNGYTAGFNRSVILGYCHFEANYYDVHPEVYKSELLKIHRSGYSTVLSDLSVFAVSVPRRDAIDLFWDHIEKARDIFRLVKPPVDPYFNSSQSLK